MTFRTNDITCNIECQGVTYKSVNSHHVLNCRDHYDVTLDDNSHIRVTSSASYLVSNAIYINLYGPTQNLHIDTLKIQTKGCSPIAASGSGLLNIYVKGYNELRVDKTGTSESSSYPAVFCMSEYISIAFYEESGSSESYLLAIGYDSGPGIGNCYDKNHQRVECNSLIFYSGTFEVYGGHFAAGIGTGDGCKIDSIIINGGTIITQGHQGAGIGACAGSEENIATVSSIIINGGNITASSLKFGAGIGGGMGHAKLSATVGTITIYGGIINATGGAGDDSTHIGGAGIGGGRGEGDHSSTVENIYIRGGTIYSYGGLGSASIGGGGSQNNNDNHGHLTAGSVNNIVITNNVTKFLAASLTDVPIGRGVSSSQVHSLTIYDQSIAPDTVNLHIVSKYVVCRFQYNGYKKVCGYPDYYYPDEVLPTMPFTHLWNQNIFQLFDPNLILGSIFFYI